MILKQIDRETVTAFLKQASVHSIYFTCNYRYLVKENLLSKTAPVNLII